MHCAMHRWTPDAVIILRMPVPAMQTDGEQCGAECLLMQPSYLCMSNGIGSISHPTLAVRPSSLLFLP